MPNENFSALETERVNPDTKNIDTLPPEGIVSLIHAADGSVADAVTAALPAVAAIAASAAESFAAGGRLIYLGAGTSGRLGVLDAVECRPTFGAPDGMVIGLLAGGLNAMFRAVEGAEDSLTLAAEDLDALQLTKNDTVVGIAASGRTPYVVGGLNHARAAGCRTGSVACTPNAVISSLASPGMAAEAVTGPEVIAGSTRMKAGTATKMILNMISTTAFILSGKTWGNLMVDVRATNEKLVARALRIIKTGVGCGEDEAKRLLDASGGEVKTALVMGLCGVPKSTAETLLSASNGRVAPAIEAGMRPHSL
ncbi:MAG: N-acetylmuramic acid 6-phosphate etherase [Clostridiales bacterium]|nr:N-acetylmuramic acid 6-phosphate etherase [Clostridiales bacterium]